MTADKPRVTFCDGVDRRTFLRAGGLALGGIGLPELLRAESQSPKGGTKKSIIMVFLSGGPPHQDMVDLKMDAPSEIRGEFQPISTAVSGIQICEHLPLLAQRMNSIAIIRSLVGSEGRHAAFQCLTGWPVDRQPAGGWPSFGSVVSKLKGPARGGTPAFVSLAPKMRTSTWADPGQAGFVGQAHVPFTPNAEGQANLILNGITIDQLQNRQLLMGKLDRIRRDIDASGASTALTRIISKHLEF